MSTQRAPAAGIVTATGAHPEAQRKERDAQRKERDAQRKRKSKPALQPAAEGLMLTWPPDAGLSPAADLADLFVQIPALYYEHAHANLDVRDVNQALELARRELFTKHKHTGSF